MTSLQLLDLAGTRLRSIEALHAEGNERELAERLFRGGFDVACLPDAPDSSVKRFQRAGIACIDADCVQLWKAPDITATIASGGEWNDTPGDWRSTCHEALSDHLGDAAAVECMPTGSFWCAGNRTIIRRAETLEVTAHQLDDVNLDWLATAVHALAGRLGLIQVPVRQVALASLLGGRGFTLVDIRKPRVLVPMLQASLRPVLLREFSVTGEDIARFGESCGDLNPLHFDDAYARSFGFEGRIAHGMLFYGWLTRLLGTEYPGAGTIFLGNTTTFLAPVYPGRCYQARLSIPIGDDVRGTYRILAQLSDKDGRMVAISRNDVLCRKPGPESVA